MQKLANVSAFITGRTDPEKYLQKVVPDYAIVFFDHLHSEYLAMKAEIKNKEVIKLLDSLHEKRVKFELTWSDIYAFDLTLVDERPLENLIRKAYDARSKYRSLAGQTEYAEYLASRPPDLTSILIGPPNAKSAEVPISSPDSLASPDNAPPESEQIVRSSAAIVTNVLRADVRYLLNKFYLYYAMLPMRERTREQLTTHTVKMTTLIIASIAILSIISLGGSSLVEPFFARLIAPFIVTVNAVAFAGVMGGCISMLQRIQNAPVEGDALFNLAALTNSWRGLSLSPFYGAVFASILFGLFAAGILQGPAFPKIETTSSIEGNPQPQSTNANAAPTPPFTDTQRSGVLHITDFLKATGPRDGVSFALLMIWSFIAGFAERLVPDILNRFVARTEAIQEKKL